MVIKEPKPGEYSLYFHIPFCTKKCGYCHFFVLPDSKESHKTLLKGFILEWERCHKKIHTFSKAHTDKAELKSIYFGGGTPSLFGSENIAKMLKLIKEDTRCDLTKIEITLEANPDHITIPLMQSYKDAGINRVSIGVQSFDDNLLKTLTRTHNSQTAAQSVLSTKEAGIDNITIDLMYELPHQTKEIWHKTLFQAVNLPITHLSLYNLTFEPSTLFFKKQNLLKKALPKEEDTTDMIQDAAHLLKEAGLIQYEISAFAKANNYSCHNTGYWLGRPFLGLGPSAFSYWKGSRTKNISHLNRYLKLLKEGLPPVDYKEALPDKKRLRELFAINLRLFQGVHASLFEMRHGPLFTELKETLEYLKGLGLIQYRKKRWKLTTKGRLLYDSVAAEII